MEWFLSSRFWDHRYPEFRIFCCVGCSPRYKRFAKAGGIHTVADTSGHGRPTGWRPQIHHSRYFQMGPAAGSAPNHFGALVASKPTFVRIGFSTPAIPSAILREPASFGWTWSITIR